MTRRLVKLSGNDGADIYEMLQGIGSNENGFGNDVKDMPREDFAAWLQVNAGHENSMGLPEGWVPQTTYWLCAGGVPVGCGRIRHYLNDALKKDGGHIGYAISAPHRGQGHGSALLGLLLRECKQMGIDEVHIGANSDNIPSNRIIMRHGGALCRQTESKNHYIINNR